MSMTREEIIRIRNRACANEWPKVWNRQLNELCDIALEVEALRREVESLQMALDAVVDAAKEEWKP